MDPESTIERRHLATRTRSLAEAAAVAEVRIPALTILAHPDPRRIGERAPLAPLAGGQELALSRLEPLFGSPSGGRRRPLGDPHLSRKPLILSALPEAGVRLRIAGRARVEADGRVVKNRRDFSTADLERGTVLLISQRIALLLHRVELLPDDELPGFGLVGESTAVTELRRQIARVADLEVSVLLRGETGTGKELVARALHHTSPRRSRPFVAVNMGAVPSTLAAAELFGASRGAFTGADRWRRGYFARADGGTLFLDEIGEMPPEVQVLLLRTLESGTIQPIGGERAQQVDVRVVAATDARLEAEIEAGRFRAPLLHRLSGFEIRLPPLRHRRDDVGRLLIHFLRQELEALGELWRLERAHEAPQPWLPAPLVARLAAWSWPGNVRQLRNVTRQLVIGNRGAAQLAATAEIEALLAPDAPAAEVEPTPRTNDLADAAGSTEPAESTGQPVVKTLLGIEWADRDALADPRESRHAFDLMRRHQRTARALLPDYDGLEIAGAEGFLLLFDRPSDAVGYALEYHELVADLARDTGKELQARAAVYLGEMLVYRGLPEEVARGAASLEIDGLSRRRTARLTALASGRQTLLNRGAFELARQAAQGGHPLAQPAVRWLEHGPHRFAESAQPVEIFEVGLEGAAPLAAPVAGEDVRPLEGSADPGSSTAVDAAPSVATRRGGYRNPREVSDDELLRALLAHQFRLQPTAAALGISRTSLYALVDKSPRVRKARDLNREEIEGARDSCTGDLDAMAAELEVSRKGLRRRMTQLGL